MRDAPLKIIIALVFTAVTITLGVIYAVKTTSNPIACTEEAKQCSDGSYVGRTGPHCEFAACPSATLPPPGADCTGPGDACSPGYTCIQKCGPPVVRVDDPPPGYYCELDAIAKQPRICPI